MVVILAQGSTKNPGFVRSAVSDGTQKSLLSEKLLPVAWSKPFGDHTVWLKYCYIAKAHPDSFGLGGVPEIVACLFVIADHVPLHSVSKSRTA